MTEYKKLFDLLLAVKRWAGKINLLKTGLIELADILWAEPVKILYIQLAATHCYPEFSLVTCDPIFATATTFNPFPQPATSRHQRNKSLYSTILDDLLRDCLSVSIPKVIGLSISYYNQILPAFYCAYRIKTIAPQVQ